MNGDNCLGLHVVHKASLQFCTSLSSAIVKKGLQSFLGDTQVDEIMVASCVYDIDAKIHLYELIGEFFWEGRFVREKLLLAGEHFKEFIYCITPGYYVFHYFGDFVQAWSSRITSPHFFKIYFNSGNRLITQLNEGRPDNSLDIHFL